MSLRQLRVLVDNLPPDGALGRAIRGHNWVDANYQLADLFDMLHRLFSWQVAAHGKDAHYQEPKPFPRPGVVDPAQERKERSAANTVAYMEHYRKARGA